MYIYIYKYTYLPLAKANATAQHTTTAMPALARAIGSAPICLDSLLCFCVDSVLGSTLPPRKPQTMLTAAPVARQPTILPDTTTPNMQRRLDVGMCANASGICTRGGAKRTGTKCNRAAIAGPNQTIT